VAALVQVKGLVGGEPFGFTGLWTAAPRPSRRVKGAPVGARNRTRTPAGSSAAVMGGGWGSLVSSLRNLDPASGPRQCALTGDASASPPTGDALLTEEPESLHDRTRVRINGSGSFSQIWKNLLTVRDSDLPVDVLLRIHLTPANLSSCRSFSSRSETRS
jgi:hypothetical protein